MSNNSTKRICLAIPSLKAGGMERVMSEVANDFANRKNVEVHLLLFGKEREIFYDIEPNIIVHRPQFVFNNKVRTYNTLKTIFFIRQEVKKIKPDSVLSFGDYWNSLVLLSCLGLKTKIYVSDRGKPCIDSSKLQHILRTYLYPKASGVIAQTKAAKDFYSNVYKQDNMTIIGNPFKENQTHNVTREKIILSVGRLQNTKHFDRLIHIFSELYKEHEEWKLIIVGGDTMLQNNSQILKKLIDEMGLSSNVLLAGNQKDVWSFYKRSSIFALTSSSEGFPNVIGEAMMAGIPVISYNCVAGPSDMIEDGKNGFLVPVFDDEMMKKRLLFLMENEEERIEMGNYAKESIKKFSSPIICQMFFDFITKQA